MITTVWALEQDRFDQGDILWCRGLGVEIKVEPLYYNCYINGQLVNQVVEGLRIRLTTTCDKQESMLKLKYGVKLIEVQRISTLPGHDLHEIDF